MEYHVVHAWSRDYLMFVVNAMLATGWKLQGGVAWIDREWCQAMIKEA